MLSRLPYEMIGNQSSSSVLIFLHGWPDTYHLWDPLIHHLSDDFLCLNISYPNFSTMSRESKWGYDFPAINQALKNTIDEVYSEINVKEKIVVSHDWGCFFGYFLDQKYPKYIDSMVALDVSPYIKLNSSIAFYQLSLASAFLVDGILGKLITKKFLKIMQYESPWQKSISSHLNYPYYYFWKNAIKSKFGLADPLLKNYVPSIPITYLYAKDKPKHIQFQTQQWFDWLEKNQGKHIAVEGGHWFIEKNQDLLVNLIKERSFHTK